MQTRTRKLKSTKHVSRFVMTIVRLGMKLKLVAYAMELKDQMTHRAERVKDNFLRLGALALWLIPCLLVNMALFCGLIVFCLHFILGNWIDSILLVLLLNSLLSLCLLRNFNQIRRKLCD